MLKVPGAFWVAVTAALLSGCATVVSDNDTKTHIATKPELASCELTGEDFRLVIKSPGTVVLPSSAAPVTVACQTEGYKTTTDELDTSVDGWIFGNIILGGVIGAVIDGVRGAGMKYPEEILIILEPESFAGEAARDEFYDSRIADAEKEWERLFEKFEAQCSRRAELQPHDCDKRLEKMRSDRDKEVAEIEERRSGAVVVKVQAEDGTDT